MKRVICGLAAVLLLACAWASVRLQSARAEEKTAPGEAAQKSAEFKPEQVEFFEKEVQPILKARCLKCHGGEEKIRGGLKVTSRQAMLKGGDQGSVVDLESPSDSLFLQAINYDGLEMPPGGRLPKSVIETLTKWVEQGLPWTPGVVEAEAPEAPRPDPAAVIAAAKQYWAYRPLARPAVPDVRQTDEVRNGIDRFILAKLEAAGLEPAKPADRVALIRRVYYDLVGLPPSPEAVDAFVKDTDPLAYEKLVDRLLDSPQYGEKWGRHWLDLVRYAETHGYERDSAKPFAWRYRDYVIDAFNRDKPYDQFLREQFAGDQLDAVTPESMIATGFYRLGLWDDEPADRPLAKYDILDGIVSTTSQVVLGMTVGCARCHDHKKDPIPQRDYYRLMAFFHDVTDMNVQNTRKVATADERREHSQRLRDKQLREGELYAQVYELEQRFAAALAEKQGVKFARNRPADLVELSYRFYRDTWAQLPEFGGLKPETAGPLPQNFVTLAPASRQEAIGLVFEGRLQLPQAGRYTFAFESTEGLRVVIDGKPVIQEPSGGQHRGEVTAELSRGLVPFRLEYFNSNAVPVLKLTWSGPGIERRSLTDESTGLVDPVLVADSRREGQEWVYTTSTPADNWRELACDDSGWSRGPGGFGVRGTPGSVVRTEWSSANIWMRRRFKLDSVPVALTLDLHHDDDVEVYLNGSLVHRGPGYGTEYRSVMLEPEALAALRPGENLIAVHCRQTIGGQYIDVGLRQPPEREVLAELFRRQGPEVLGREVTEQYRALARQLDESRKSTLPEPGIDVMCVDERGRAQAHVLIRGNPGAHGEAVDAGIPVVLDDETPTPFLRDQTPARRRALADWFTGPGSPVTARVMVNRLWQHHFGRGIVPTPNDFGQLGEAPTHPELLDWLAAEFIEGGWRIKRMHRLLMLSNTYRLSSRANPEGLKTDPANTLFWRFNMRRLSAEEVRDSILAVTGRLDLKAGGPSVYPPIPTEVLASQSMPGSGWGKSTPEEASRRSVYVHVKRSLLVPILAQHDQADTDSSCPVRFTTTVPTQSLGMLNGEFTQEQSRELAQRLEWERPGNLPAQIERAIRLTTTREPGADEVNHDVEFVLALQKQGGLSAADALRHYCLLALNANEFIYLD